MHARTEVWPVAVAALACFFAGGLYGWSALISPLQSTFGISTAEAGAAFSLAVVSFTCAVLVAPSLLRTVPPQCQIFGLAILGVVCLLYAMFAGHYWAFLLWFSFGFGAVSGALYIVTVGIAAAVPMHRIATPVVVASFGAGGAVFGPLWKVLAGWGWGLNGLLFLQAGLLLTGLLALAFRVWPVPAAVSQPSGARAPTRGLISRVCLLWLTFALGSFGGLMILGLAAKIMETAGSGLAWVSAVLAGIAICNTAGRLSVAWISRTMGLQSCLLIAWAMGATGLALSLLGGAKPAGLGAGLILVAGGYGMVASTIPVLTRVAVGPEAFKPRFALIFTAWGVAGLSAPWMAGALFDATASFTSALVTAFLACLVFGLSALILVRHLRRDGVELCAKM